MNNLTKKTYVFLLPVLILGFISPLIGQVGIQSVGVNFGWYKPSLDYWNDTSKISTWDSKFNGSFLGQINIVANLYSPLKAKLELGYWRESAKQSNTPIGLDLGTEEVSLSFIPVTATLLFDIPFGPSDQISPYIGVGGSGLFIRKTFISSPNSGSFLVETDSGFDYTAHFSLGAEQTVAEGLAIGLEFRYVFGTYTQQVQNSAGGPITSESVSISGPQINFTWIYLLSN